MVRRRPDIAVMSPAGRRNSRNRCGVAFFAARLATLALLESFCPAARADGVLAQMQSEMTAIVARTRTAVVAVEDERVLQQGSFTDHRRHAGPPWRGSESSPDMAALRARLTSLTENLNRLQTDARTSKAEREKAERLRVSLEREISNLQQKLAAATTRPSGESTREADLPKSGTGFSIGDGYVVTTADVLEGMQSPVVVTDSGVCVRSRVVGIDPVLNVGLLKVLARIELPALRIGDSASVLPGQFALSIGNRYGQTNSVALMLIGGFVNEGRFAGRRYYPSLIHITGTVGAGLSGGPLVNSQGELIGMLAAVPVPEDYEPSKPYFDRKARDHGDRSGIRARRPDGEPSAGFPRVVDQSAPAGGAKSTPERTAGSDRHVGVPVRPAPGSLRSVRPFSSGSGFAVPINDMRPVIEELRAEMPRQRSWIGIRTRDDVHITEHNNILARTRDVVVRFVLPGSPAARGGLLSGDILISLNGKPIRSTRDVREAHLQSKPGDRIEVVFRRGTIVHTAQLLLDSMPNFGRR